MRKSNVIDIRSRSAYVYKSDDYSLRNCLECCTVEDLEDIALYQGMELPGKLKKEALINLLEIQILGDFKRLLPYFLPEDIELLDLVVSGMPCRAEDMMERDLYIYDLGFIYFFYESEWIHPVLPSELRELLGQALENGLLEQLPFRQEIADYVEALLNFYGIYEISQLVEVWNAHHRKNITYDQAWEQLTGMEDVLACYWCDEGLVVSDYFADYQEVDIFMDMVRGLPYYMPSKGEIASGLIGGLYSVDSLVYQQIELFVKAKKAREPEAGWESDNIIHLILDGALFNLEAAEVAKELEAKEGFSLVSQEENRRFTDFYNQYRYRTRSWALRGYVPREPADGDGAPEAAAAPAEQPGKNKEKPRFFTIRGGK